MKTISPRLVAATALALMMTEAPGIALAAKGQSSAVDQIIVGPASQRQLLLAQSDSATEAAPEEATGDDQQPRRKKRADQEQEQEAPAAQQEAPAPAEPAPAEQAKPAPEPAPVEPAREAEKPAEPAPAQDAKPAPEAAPAPAATEQEAGETRQQRRERERREAQEQRQQQDAEKPSDAAPAEKPAEQANPAPDATPAPAATEQEAGETRQQRRERERREAQEQREKQQQEAEKPAETAPAEKPSDSAQPDQPATPPQQPPVEQAQPPQQTLPGSGGTPILDSQKEQPRPADDGQQATRPAPVPAAPAGPPPTSDKEAQKETVKVEDIVPVTKEEGRRIDRPQGERREERERRDGVDVLREIAGRVILDLGGRPTVESDDRSRLERGARDVYYEELSRGRTRETIVRPNGVQVVTIRDRYGEIIRRSRIMPDGREIVLSYVDEERRGPPRGQWRDPGYDLPPLVLNIPVDEYILDAERAESDDDYYDFLEQPPVERVERYYSIDEVKRSARVRDSVRRVDLDTITFDFGSADIKEDAVQRLDNVARAMERMLEKNPAETFLIEGHTDAVGSDLANLALSDRRAEAVARALTEVFDIPPENLTTQGYGEQYLKVKTEAPEQANRRVAIRRITPLVTPVADAR